MEKQKSRILIIEDEGLIATHLEHVLTTLDYDVVGIIASGEKALEQVQETLPDLVLMDVNLAGELDGVETAAQIREQFDIPVVYLTGYAEETVTQRDRLGRIVNESERWSDGVTSEEVSYIYHYDEAGRLEQVTRTSGGTSTVVESYTYDDNGNRTSAEV